MAAFTGSPTGSTQYTAAVSTTPRTVQSSSDWGSKLRVSFFSYTHAAAAGAGTGQVNLVRLPAGRVRVLSDLCRLVTSQFGAAATIDIGARAYVNEAGTPVVENGALFHDDGAAGAGALDVVWALPAVGVHEFQSQTGVVLFATIAAGDIETGDTIEGYVTFMQGN